MIGKSGSSRKRAASRSFLKKRQQLPKIHSPGDQTKRLNNILVDLSKKTETELEYWRIYQQYLVNERERRKERIHEALRSKMILGYTNDQLVRIVDTRYQTRPLSSYGSIAVPPGGRFNFGEISSYHQQFQSLYLASNFSTAAAERFLRNQVNRDAVDQESLDFRLDPNASFSSYRVRVSNLTVIDISDEQSLRPFLEVISEIKLPAWLFAVAKAMRQPQPQVVQTVAALKTLLFDPNFLMIGNNLAFS